MKLLKMLSQIHSISTYEMIVTFNKYRSSYEKMKDRQLESINYISISILYSTQNLAL